MKRRHLLCSAYFSLKGCVKLALPAIESQEAEFPQPIGDKFALLSITVSKGVSNLRARKRAALVFDLSQIPMYLLNSDPERQEESKAIMERGIEVDLRPAAQSQSH